MVRMNAFTASLLARKSIQLRHQRQSLGQNERVFIAFVFVFVIVLKFPPLSFLIAGLTRDLWDCGSEAAMRGVPVIVLGFVFVIVIVKVFLGFFNEMRATCRFRMIRKKRKACFLSFG